MNSQIEIESFYDSLSIAHKLDKFLDGFERQEIHLFSYFSAFLFHYNGNPIDDWKYKFVIGPDSFPHSKHIDDAIERHLSVGAFEVKTHFLSITARGTDEFNKFKNSLVLFKKREEFLDAACTTSILIPYNETKKALLNDTNIEKAKNSKNESWIDFQYEKLREVTKTLGTPIEDINLSALSWIQYLLNTL